MEFLLEAIFNAILKPPAQQTEVYGCESIILSTAAVTCSIAAKY